MQCHGLKSNKDTTKQYVTPIAVQSVAKTHCPRACFNIVIHFLWPAANSQTSYSKNLSVSINFSNLACQFRMYISNSRHIMMMSWRRNAFGITGPLWRNPPAAKKGRLMRNCGVLSSKSCWTKIELLMIWDAVATMWRHCNIMIVQYYWW